MFCRSRVNREKLSEVSKEKKRDIRVIEEFMQQENKYNQTRIKVKRENECDDVNHTHHVLQSL